MVIASPRGARGRGSIFTMPRRKSGSLDCSLPDAERPRQGVFDLLEAGAQFGAIEAHLGPWSHAPSPVRLRDLSSPSEQFILNPLPLFLGKVSVIGGKFSGTGGAVGQCVAAFVFGMPRVTFDPAPGNLMHSSGHVEPLPEVGVLEMLLVRPRPPARLPCPQPPLRHRVHEVTRIRVQSHAAWHLEGFQTRDRGEDFHPVVGRALEST